MTGFYTDPCFFVQAEQLGVTDRSPEDVTHVFRVFQALLKVVIYLSQIIAFQKQIVNINIINFYLPYYYLYYMFLELL